MTVSHFGPRPRKHILIVLGALFLMLGSISLDVQAKRTFNLSGRGGKKMTNINVRRKPPAPAPATVHHPPAPVHKPVPAQPAPKPVQQHTAHQASHAAAPPPSYSQAMRPDAPPSYQSLYPGAHAAPAGGLYASHAGMPMMGSAPAYGQPGGYGAGYGGGYGRGSGGGGLLGGGMLGNVVTGLAVWNVARALSPGHRQHTVEHVYVNRDDPASAGTAASPVADVQPAAAQPYPMVAYPQPMPDYPQFGQHPHGYPDTPAAAGQQEFGNLSQQLDITHTAADLPLAPHLPGDAAGATAQLVAEPSVSTAIVEQHPSLLQYAPLYAHNYRI